MTLSSTRKTTSRSVVAVAAVAAASTLAACGSANTSATAPSASTSAAETSSAAPSPSATSTTATPQQAQKTQDNRASRDTQRKALTAGTGTTTVKTWNWTEQVPASTNYVYSASLPKGQSKVTREGTPGQITITYASTIVDGKTVSTVEKNVHVDRYITRRIVTVGTGQAAAPATPKVSTQATRKAVSSAPAQTQQKAATPTVSRSTVRKAVSAPVQTQQQTAPAPKKQQSAPAPATSPNAGGWAAVAQCESGGNWAINTGNGFQGGLQFTQQTWAGYGGLAYAPSANLASAAQQMAVADKVKAAVGLGAWPVCGSRF